MKLNRTFDSDYARLYPEQRQYQLSRQVTVSKASGKGREGPISGLVCGE